MDPTTLKSHCGNNWFPQSNICMTHTNTKQVNVSQTSELVSQETGELGGNPKGERDRENTYHTSVLRPNSNPQSKPRKHKLSWGITDKPEGGPTKRHPSQNENACSRPPPITFNSWDARSTESRTAGASQQACEDKESLNSFRSLRKARMVCSPGSGGMKSLHFSSDAEKLKRREA